MPDQLELRYVPLTQAVRWDANPKKHALDALVTSIETYGFGDPPKYESTLEALVYGNGRTEALERMRADDKEPPRGIAVLEDGEWAVPVIFGVDAESHAAAVAFAIDHNNLGLMGGKLGFEDLLAIWDEEGLQAVLVDAREAAGLLASFDDDEIESLLGAPGFEPASAEDQSRLDRSEVEALSCPECGHEWIPE